MRVFICPTPDEIGKFQGIVHTFPTIWNGRILDVGARSGRMNEVIRAIVNPGNAQYCSVDLFPPADIIANLEKGLPVADNSFDVVLALDILEHTDNIYLSFSELCRVSKRFIVITLPNIYEIKGRFKFLQGLPLSGKYGLPTVPPKDRHRWVFSFREALNFVHHQSQSYGFLVVSDGCLVGPRRKVVRFMIMPFANLLAPTYLALLERVRC